MVTIINRLLSHLPQKLPSKKSHLIFWFLVLLFIEQLWEDLYMSTKQMVNHSQLWSLTVIWLLAIFIPFFYDYLKSITNPWYSEHQKITKKQWLHIPLLIILGNIAIGLINNFTMYVLLNNKHVQTSINQQDLSSFTHGSTNIIFFVFLTIGLAPVIEEFVFHKLIITSPNKKQRIKQAIISFVLFAVLHVLTSFFMPYNQDYWIKLGMYFLAYSVISLILVYEYYMYHNYRYNVFLHSSWNLITVLIMLI